MKPRSDIGLTLADLLVTTVSAELAPRRPWSPGGFPPVTLRGALGAAVLQVACVRPQPDCRTCEHATDCAVPQWYEPGRLGGHAPRPFALHVHQCPDGRATPDHPLRVRWTLHGPVPRPSLLTEAIFHAARRGLGPARTPHDVRRIAVTGEREVVTVVHDNLLVGDWPRPGRLGWVAPAPGAAGRAAITFVSPTQLTGITHRKPPAVGDVLRHAIHRVRALARHHGTRLNMWWPEPTGILGTWTDWVWHGQSRWSQRQNHAVDLSGFTGTLTLEGPLNEWSGLLSALPWTGIGRGVSCGLGVAEVRWT